MKKSLKKVMLFGAMLLALGASFVGCKDYDDDIDDLQNQIDKLAKNLDDLKDQVSGYVTDVTYDANSGMLTVKSGGTDKQLQLPKGTEIPTYEFDLKLDGNKVQLIVNEKVEGEITLPDNGGSIDPVDPTEFKLTMNPETGEIELNGEGTGIFIPEVPAQGSIVFDANSGTVTITLLNPETGEMESATFLTDNGYQLSSLAFIPEWINKGVYQAVWYRVADNSGRTLATSKADLTFRINPTAANVSNVDWKFLNRRARITSRAAGDNYDLVSIVGTPVVANGTITLKTDIDYTKSVYATSLNSEIRDIFALEGTIAKDTVVVSDYIEANIITATGVYVGDTIKYRAGQALASVDYYLTQAAAYAGNANHTIPYNTTGINLNDYVLASVNVESARQLLVSIGINDYTYKFSEVAPGSNLGSDGETDQQQFVNLDANGNVTVNMGTAAISRRPIFKVDLVSATGLTMASAYIKFEITATAPVAVERTVTGTFNYADLYKAEISGRAADQALLTLDWLTMNGVYDELKVSHDQFRAAYNAPTVINYGSDANHATTYGPLGNLVVSQEGQNVDTYALSVEVLPTTTFGSHSWTVVYTPVNSVTHAAVTIKFNFNVAAPAKPEFSPLYAPNGIQTAKGKLVNGVFKMQTTLKEAFVDYMEPWIAGVDDVILRDTHVFAFRFTNNYASSAVLVSSASNNASATQGVIDAISGVTGIPTTPAEYVADYKVQDIKIKDVLTTANRIYDVAFRSHYENGEVMETPYQVEFINPFNIVIDDISLKTLTTPSTVDLNNIVKVYANDELIYNGSTGWLAAANKYVDAAYRGFSYDLKTTAVTGGRLTINGSIVTWNNEGSILNDDITSEKVSISVTTDYAASSTEKTITLLSSDHSN